MAGEAGRYVRFAKRQGERGAKGLAAVLANAHREAAGGVAFCECLRQRRSH